LYFSPFLYAGATLYVSSQLVCSQSEVISLLYDLQHGFRHSRSCETQLLSFVQELAANSDKNIQTNLIIMDFAKAFDKVPHQGLLYKLKFYGIKSQLVCSQSEVIFEK
jgi:hypothetical protein